MVDECGVVGVAMRFGQLLCQSLREWLEREPAAEDLNKAVDFEERRKALQSSLPSGYTLVTESRDGKFCLYQDREGHLAAVDARKFL